MLEGKGESQVNRDLKWISFLKHRALGRTQLQRGLSRMRRRMLWGRPDGPAIGIVIIVSEEEQLYFIS